MSTQSGWARFARVAFRTTALVEAISWAGLITALIIKYPLDGSPLGVTVWGWVHGVVWIAFVIACMTAAITFRWGWWVAVIGVLISVVPFLTVPFDVWMERISRLHRRRRCTRSTALASTQTGLSA